MNNYNVQIAVGPPRRESETLAEYLTRCSKQPKGIWDERCQTYILPSGTVKQGRRPMFQPFTEEIDSPWSLRDEGRSDGYGESYGERNT